MQSGAVVGGDTLKARSIEILRSGARNSWLEVVLDGGRNRPIRRLLDAYDVEVLRLIRVAIGRLPLGDLAKGKARHLTTAELALLSG